MVKTLSGVTNFTVSDTLKVKKVSANNSLGTNGQVLTTNGSATYWSTPVAEVVVNTAAQYVWTNTHIFNANVTVNAALIANGSPGTAGQVLHSNGSAIYWAADDFNVNTTYDLLAVANTETNKGILRLKDVNNSNDDVYITGAGGVAVSSNDSHIIITGAPGDITGVNAGDGLTGTASSGEATLSVLANTGIVANTSGTFVNAAYIATIASNTANYANASYTNTFTVGTATYFVSNGNVGVGTTSPADKLHVSGGNVRVDSNQGINFGGSTNFIYGNHASNFIASVTNNIERMRITSAGNVGIGNTTPTDTLSVNGKSYFGANVTLTAALIANGGAGSAGQVLHSNGSATYWAADDNVNTTYDLLTVANTEANKAIIRLQDSGNANDDVFIIGANGITTTSNSSGAYAYAVGSSTVTVNTAGIHVNPNLTISNLTASYANVNNDLYVGGNVAIQGNLTVYGTSTLLQGNTITFTDNMLYLNQGVSANITAISGNGTYVTFTANNNYQAGWDVSVTGVNPSSYNGTYQNIFAANATHFVAANTNTATYVSGGTARGKSDQNPDLGIAAGYNDGTYHHTGIFRDASDGYWKVFDGYLPEPDASINIDTSNTSFNIAGFWSGNTRVGNTTVYTSISNFGINFAASGYEVNPTGARFGFYNGGGTPQTYMQMPAGGEIVFWNAGTAEVMRIANNNKVGIGTNNPSTILSVIDNSGIDTQISAYGAANKKAYFRTNSGYGVNQTFGTDDIGGFMYVETDHPFYISTGNSHIYFSTSRAERMRIAANGNIGIGTVSPSNRLTVNGSTDGSTALITSGTDNNYLTLGAAVNFGSDNNAQNKWSLRWRGRPSGSNHYLSVYDELNAAERVRILSNGDVGIGQSSVTGVFGRTISATGPNGATFRFAGATVSGYVYASDGLGYAGITTETNHPLIFATNSTERARITASGEVLVGATTNPWGAKLYVKDLYPIVTIEGTDNTTRQAALQFGTAGGNWSIVNSNDLTIKNGAPAEAITTGSYAVFGRTTGPLILGTTGVERMRISNTGNVGIGISDPTYRLVVNSGSTTTTSIFKSTGTSAFVGIENASQIVYYGSDNTGSFLIQTPGNSFSTKLLVDSAGNLGLGVTPSAWGGAGIPAFQRGSSSFFEYGFNNTIVGSNFYFNGTNNKYFSNGYASYYQQYLGGHTWATAASGVTANNITFTQAMTLTASGNLGIGLTDPTASLHIKGPSGDGKISIQPASGGRAYNLESIGGSHFRIYDASATVERLRITPDGNVGIGTSSPVSRLHVTDLQAIITAQSTSTGGSAAKLNLITNWTGTDYTASIENDWSGAGFLFKTSRDLTNSQGGFVFQSASGTNSMVIRTNSGNVGIGTDSPLVKLDVYGTRQSATIKTISNLFDTQATNVDVGAGIGFGGKYDATNYAHYALVGGRKENNTSGNYAGYLVFETRPNALELTERARITSAGEFLIGTTTVSKTFTAKGTGLAVVAGGTQNSGNEIFFYRSDLLNMAYIGWQTPSSANSPWWFNSVNGNPIAWGSSGTERMRLTDAGNLGINTTSPGSLLHLGGASNKSIFVDTALNRAYFGGWQDFATIGVNRNPSDGAFADVNKAAASIGVYSANADSYIAFNTTPTNNTTPSERMRIDAGGNVSIGAASTSNYKLRVNAVNSGLLVITSGATGALPSQYWIDQTHSVEAILTPISTGVYFGSYTNHPLIVATNNTERMRIDTSGTVTLTGTTDKKVSFVRSGANTFSIEHDTSRIYFWNATTANVVLSMTNDSRVGIGTGSPVTKFEVNGAGKFFSTDARGLYIRGRSDGDDAAIMVYQTNANNDQASIAAVANSLRFYTANSSAVLNEHIRITTGGNVGIGVTNPNYKLDVNGEIAIRGGESADDARMYFQASDNSNRFTVETDLDGTTLNDLLIFRSSSFDNTLVVKGNGRVGVNTDNPQATLDVNGEIRALSISGYNLSNNATSIDTGLVPTDFTILEVFGSANPNSDGSSNYRDPIHLYIYKGTGWNGSAVTDYVYAQSIAPPARSAFPSGGISANENMSVVWVKNGVESDSCPMNDNTYSLRIKISNYSTTSYFSLRIVRRF